MAEGCTRDDAVAVAAAVEAEEPPDAAAEDGTIETVGTADTAAAGRYQQYRHQYHLPVEASKGKDEAIAQLAPPPRVRRDRHRHRRALLPTFEPRPATLVEADLRRQL